MPIMPSEADRLAQLQEENDRLRQQLAAYQLLDAQLHRQRNRARTDAHQALVSNIATLPNLMLEVDRTGAIHDFFTTQPEMLGVPAEVVCDYQLEAILPDAAPAIMQQVAACLAAGEMTESTLLRQMPAGPARYGLSIIPLPAPAGDTRCQVLLHHTTELQRSEQALIESEQRFRRLANSIPDGLTIIEASRVVYTNQRAAQIFGVSREEISQLRGIDLAAPEERERLLLIRNEMKPQGRMPDELQFWIVRPDGSRRYIRNRYIASNVPGHTDEYFIVTTDITEAYQAEQKLRSSEARFRGIFEAAPIGVAIARAGGVLSHANPALCAMLGYTEDELIGKHYAELTHPDDLAEEQHLVEELIAGQRSSYQYDKRYIRNDGSTLRVRVTSSLTREEGQGPGMGFALIENIEQRHKIEQELRISEARFRLLAENTSDVVALQTLAGKVLYVNPSLQHVLGYPVEEFEQGFLGIIYPADVPLVRARALLPAMGGHKLNRVEYRAYHQSGQLIWLETVLEPILNDTGEVIRLLSTSRDITRRKLIEQELRISKERYDRAIAASQTGIWEWDTSTGEMVLSANLKALLGYGEDEIDNKLASWYALIHPDDRTRVRDLANAHLRGEQPHIEIEHRMIDRQGRDHWVLLRGRRLANEHTSNGRLVGTITDISDSKQAQDALQQSELKFRSIVQRSHDGIVLIDSTGNIVEWNAGLAQITGLGPAETLNRPFWAVQASLAESSPDITRRMNVLREMVQHSLQSGQGEWLNHRKEVTYRRPDGQGITTEEVYFPIPRGGSYLIAGIVRDITERKQAEQHELDLAKERQRVEVLQQFLGNVSHDLKTPLTTIRMNLFMLDKYIAAGGERFVQVMEKQTGHLERILEDLLSMSKLDSTSEFSFAPLNINSLLNDLLVEQESFAASKGHQLLTDLALNLPDVRGDRVYLHRALSNILMNALHYTPEGGTIHLRSFPREREVVIEVQDNGIGIEPEQVPFIFDRFYRGDQARNTEKGGTGLGLAIAKRVIEMHRGHIAVNSTPGTGSTFAVVLPARQ